jgi:deazaflavin-dependent oxidoreductase (nitroreductase family)
MCQRYQGGAAVRSIAKFVAGLVLALVTLGVVFVVGMRTKSPPVLNTVRRLGRATKGFVLSSAGTAGNAVSVVHHVGRTTGRAYETPIAAVPTDDGFVIALPYGSNTDWLKNVLASGQATIVHDGTSHSVDRPEVISIADVALTFSPNDQRAHRWFGVQDCLRVRRVAAVSPSA